MLDEAVRRYVAIRTLEKVAERKEQCATRVASEKRMSRGLLKKSAAIKSAAVSAQSYRGYECHRVRTHLRARKAFEFLSMA